MDTHKLVIIGSGPAGYTAAIYAARAMLAPVVFTGIESGGQLMYTTTVENFPGFPEGIMGPQFMQTLRAQAERFGSVIKDQHITAVDFSQRPFKLWTSLPEGVIPEIFKTANAEQIQTIVQQVKQAKPDYLAESVIISTGATAITLKVPGEKELIGQGVSTCAVCDAPFYRDKSVFVVGGGDSAMEDALTLTKFAKSVTIIHRRDQFRASKIMIDRVLKGGKISVLWNTNLEEIHGTNSVEKITVNENGQRKQYYSEGLFYAIGHRPMTEMFQGEIALNDGYIITPQSISQAGVTMASTTASQAEVIPYPTMTSVAGVFASGDVVDFRYRQAVTAAGQGSAAALDAERWLDNIKN